MPQPPEALQSELVDALIAMRDSLVRLSLLLNDIVMDCDVELQQNAFAQAIAAIEKVKALPVGTKGKAQG